MKKTSLGGKWRLEADKAGYSIEADIPGTDFGNLIKAGVIPSPLVSGDEKEALRIAENSFTFSRRFNIDNEILSLSHIHLKCSCIDTLCDCYINGKKAFRSENAFVPVDADIKKFLVEGENTIKLVFSSAYNYIKERQKNNPLPPNSNGVDGIPYIRKPACHFGWDWGPCVPYCGICGDIFIEAFDKRIENIRIRQETTHERAKVAVTADGADEIYILSPDGVRLDGFEIENPELWYTREMNGREVQPLYTVVFENTEQRVTKKIGLRSVVLDRSEDKFGANFCIVLNGERIFAKGANLIPFAAIFEDGGKNAVDYYLDLAVKSNFNILRVWGGGEYASDYFLEKCDEMGILVWQDFGFACQMYPLYDEDFRENVLKEVRANVSRMDLHPCMAVWCGNNEIEDCFGYLPKNGKLMKAYREFFYEILPKEVAKLTELPYIPSSPCGTDFMEKTKNENYGDTHLWSVWHGLKKLSYYQTRYARFLSEFGLESLPSMKAIKTFADEKSYSITSEAFNSHQKCVGGNRKMLFYLYEMFSMPKKFEYLPYLTGIVQAECIKAAAVHFRQNKGRCNGAIYWQYNDVWNCPSWSSVDFEGVPKALQYMARDFFAPVTVLCRKENGGAYITAHNDTLETQKADVCLELYNLNGKLLWERRFLRELAPNSIEKLCEVDAGENRALKINVNGRSTAEIFAPPRKLELKKANFATKLEGDTLEITADTFVYNLCVESDEIPDENYFCLFPGETRRVKFGKAPKDYKLICANNIEFQKDAAKRGLSRALFRLEPRNIAQFIYYSAK